MCSFNAHAKDQTKSSTNDFYLTWQGGYGQRLDAELGNGTKSFIHGMNVGAALGYVINSKLRAEVDYTTYVSALDKVTSTLRGPLTAEEISYAVMFNGYFSPWHWSRVTPYIGVGVGVGVIEPSIHYNRLPVPSMLHTRETDAGFAYQLMAGFRYALTSDLSIGLEYRYLSMPRISYPGDSNCGEGACSTIPYPGVNSSLAISSGLLKIEYLLNQTTQGTKNLPANMIHGLYMAGEGGLSIRDSEPFGGPGEEKIFRNGPFMGLAIGQVFNQYFKGEVEVSLRQNEVKEIIFTPMSGEAAAGDEETFAAMLNVYLTPFSILSFSPYIGGGFGYAYTTYPLHINLSPNAIPLPPTFPTFSHSDRPHDSNYGYQGMVGVNYPLSNHAFLGLEYRYFRLESITYNESDVTLTRVKINSGFTAHTVLARFTYIFGVVT